MGEQEITTVPAVPREFKIVNKKVLLLGFVVIVAALLFFAFRGSSITGNVVYEGEAAPEEENKGIYVNAQIGSMQVPLETKQTISQITIEARSSPSRIYVGKDGVTDLSELLEARIMMSDFDGVLAFDADALLTLKGTVSKLSINGLPTSATSGEIRVRIDEPLEYETLELLGVSLGEYSSPLESGKVSFNKGKIALELDQESFLVEDFIGSLKSGTVGEQGVLREGLLLDGYASNVEVGGDFQLNLRK